MPDRDRFESGAFYLATLGHELVHWTGHSSRENRAFGKKHEKEAYAFEELVAELGAAFLCGSLGVPGRHIDNHAAYIASWLKILKNDKKAIFKASSLAQSAVNRILGNTGEQLEAAGELEAA